MWEKARMGWFERMWNTYVTICNIDDQVKFDAWSRELKAGALGQPREMVWGERLGASGWGAQVHAWVIQVNVWQKPPQYCKVIILQF